MSGLIANGPLDRRVMQTKDSDVELLLLRVRSAITRTSWPGVPGGAWWRRDDVAKIVLDVDEYLSRPNLAAAMQATIDNCSRLTKDA